MLAATRRWTCEPQKEGSLVSIDVAGPSAKTISPHGSARFTLSVDGVGGIDLSRVSTTCANSAFEPSWIHLRMASADSFLVEMHAVGEEGIPLGQYPIDVRYALGQRAFDVRLDIEVRELCVRLIREPEMTTTSSGVVASFSLRGCSDYGFSIDVRLCDHEDIAISESVEIELPATQEAVGVRLILISSPDNGSPGVHVCVDGHRVRPSPHRSWRMPIVVGAAVLIAATAAIVVSSIAGGSNNRLTQTVGFTSSAPNAVVGGPSYSPSASATSGLTVSMASSTPEICSLSDGVVRFLATGVCTIDASQSGNKRFLAATTTQQSFAVSGDPQMITFTSAAPANPVVGGTYAVSATGGGSNNAVTFTIAGTSTSGCTLSPSNDVVDFTQPAGSCIIEANQSGNAVYAPAPEVEQSITVLGTPQAITFTSVAPFYPTVGGTYTVSATGGGSNIAVTFTIDPSSTSGCTIDSSTDVVSFTGPPGSCIIDANEAGGGSFAAAPQAQQTINVGPPPA